MNLSLAIRPRDFIAYLVLTVPIGLSCGSRPVVAFLARLQSSASLQIGRVCVLDQQLERALKCEKQREQRSTHPMNSVCRTQLTTIPACVSLAIRPRDFIAYLVLTVPIGLSCGRRNSPASKDGHKESDDPSADVARVVIEGAPETPPPAGSAGSRSKSAHPAPTQLTTIPACVSLAIRPRDFIAYLGSRSAQFPSQQRRPQRVRRPQRRCSPSCH
jgi:hypothetical protein